MCCVIEIINSSIVHGILISVDWIKYKLPVCEIAYSRLEENYIVIMSCKSFYWF